MQRIVTPSDMKRWDLSRIQSGIPAQELMLRAAKGLMRAVLEMRTKEESVTCICGSGNNGGDAICAAWLLQEASVPVQIVMAGNASKLTPESAYYLQLAKESGIPVASEWSPIQSQIVLDGLFGVGLNRTVEGKYAELIHAMNTSGCRILSIDVPSGLNAETGEPLGIAVTAERTVTMQFIKTGLLLGQGRRYSGHMEVCKLADDEPFDFRDALFFQENADLDCLIQPRPFDSHKGKNGHALLCVGSEQYIGAALLASRAALRSGCGILSVCVPDAVRPSFSTLPEAITIPVGASDWNPGACEKAYLATANKTVVGIGCGIGANDISSLLESVLKAGIPLVLDADGLNCLSRHRDLISLLHPNVVITPHPGEMARLLNTTVADVLSDPLSAVRSFGCVTLLKGPTTLVSDGSKTVFCTEGTPALAKGGSGDVLTGIITGLISQGMTGFDAARAGTYLLGTSAKRAYHLLGERMLLASDVIEAISFL